MTTRPPIDPAILQQWDRTPPEDWLTALIDNYLFMCRGGYPLSRNDLDLWARMVQECRAIAKRLRAEASP